MTRTLETAGLDQSSRDFLDAAICDYNRMFGSSFSTASDQFENYYKDLCLRLKNRDMDVFSAGSSVFFRSVGGWFSPVSSSCSQ